MSWNDIRTDWVNGNRSDVRKKIRTMSKARLIGIVLEVINADMATRSGTWSGDTQDLREILTTLHDARE